MVLGTRSIDIPMETRRAFDNICVTDTGSSAEMGDISMDFRRIGKSAMHD